MPNMVEEAPGTTYMRLAPSDAKDSRTIVCSALPKDTTEITAATPIKMPSMVKLDLSLLLDTACRAVMKESHSFILMPQFDRHAFG